MEPTTHEHTHIEHHSPEPKKKQSISLPAAILTGAVIIALAIVFAFGNKGTTSNTDQAAQQQPADSTMPTSVPAAVATIRDTDYVRGNKTADIAVIEYSDSDCPYCQRFHDVMKQVIAEDKNVAWVYRYFPLDIHPNAYTEAVALECVGELGGNTAFQSYLDSVINITLSPTAESNKTLIDLASKSGVGTGAFESCIKGERAIARIDADLAEAQKAGVRGTPFNIIVNTKTGEQTILPGSYPIASVKEAIKNLR